MIESSRIMLNSLIEILLISCVIGIVVLMERLMKLVLVDRFT